MTNLLYLFNPDQDLALASGEVNYMPPASARRMAEELALLPVWFADGPCSVLAPSAYNQSFLEEMLDLFPLPASLRTQAEDFSEVRSVVPWGWNPALRKRLLSLGVPDAALPSMEDIGRLRDLSHRLQAVQLLPGLQVDEVFCGESCYLTALSDCRAFVESLERCLLKAPLSGSGKGLNWCKGAFTPLIERWCARIIEQQGGVVGEPIYNKVELVKNIFSALYASKLVSYAQGFAVLQRASDAFGWHLDLASIARMWRGGCIIRSIFLNDIAAAFEATDKPKHLLLAPYFKEEMKTLLPGWKSLVAESMKEELPVPAFSSALNYFYSLTSADLPANLVQAQRDYFGAHTFERKDELRGQFFHENWTGHGGDTKSGTYNV